MTSSILTTTAELMALRDAWEDLLRRAEGTVFQSFDWLATWWEVFGHRFRLRVFAGWENGTLIGLFPCFVEEYRMPGFTVSRLRFMGEYSIFGEYHPLVDPAREGDFLEACLAFSESELRSGTAHFIDVHEFPSTSGFMERWMAGLRAHGLLVAPEPRSTRIRLALPGTEEAYFDLLSYNERALLRRHERALLKRGARFITVTDPDDTQAFDDYVALHTRLWTAKGTRGHFATRQEFTPFHRQVTRSLMRRGGAVLYFLEHEGVRFAALQAFYVHGICTAYLGGRDPEHPLMPYGPGKVLMVHLIRDAIARGCTVVDFLSGEQEYKMRLGGVPSGRYTRATIILKSPRGTRGMLYLLALRGGTMLSDLKGFHRLAPLLNRLSLWLRRGR